MEINDKFYRQYERLVWKAVRKVFRRVCYDEQDIYQDCWEKILKYSHTFDETKAQVSSWVYMVSVRNCYKYLTDACSKEKRQANMRSHGDMMDIAYNSYDEHALACKEAARYYDVEANVENKELMKLLEEQVTEALEGKNDIISHEVYAYFLYGYGLRDVELLDSQKRTYKAVAQNIFNVRKKLDKSQFLDYTE